jgi:hypothetical protein
MIVILKDLADRFATPTEASQLLWASSPTLFTATLVMVLASPGMCNSSRMDTACSFACGSVGVLGCDWLGVTKL